MKIKTMLKVVGFFLAVVPQFVFALPSDAPYTPPQEKGTFLGMNLDALDVGIGYSLRLQTLEGLLTTPVLEIAGIIETPLGIVKNNDAVNVVGGLDINLMNLVSALPGGLKVVYKLPGKLLVGCVGGYDFGAGKPDAIPHVVYRLTF